MPKIKRDPSCVYCHGTGTIRNTTDFGLPPEVACDCHATLAPEQTRKRLRSRSARNRCHARCRGWFVSDSSTYGLEIEACDDCNSMQPASKRVTDADVDLLPEARRALYQQAGRVTLTLSGEEWDRLRVMLGAPSEDYAEEFSVKQRGAWMLWVLDHHAKGAV